MRQIGMLNQLVRVSILFISSSFIVFILPVYGSMETILIQPLPSKPILDGSPGEWADIQSVEIALHTNRPDSTVQIKSVLIKAGIYDGNVYFYLEWLDKSEDALHKPWVWDSEKSKYIRGIQREDRLAIQFAIDGEYTTDWFSGNSFTADMWHWKASRSNPLGLVHDKITTISREKILRSSMYKVSKDKTIYISRPSDEGDKLYITKRYRKYQKNLMSKYILAEQPKGSSTDISAKGIWREGKWQLEISRKLDTGHKDDIAFPAKGVVLGGIAIFDHSDNDDHVISNTLQFQF